MRRATLAFGLIALVAMSSGCRCFPGFNCYADAIDDLGDKDIFWDRLYCPRLDISRAGRPDWCGPTNRRLARCRCDCEGCWDRANECWLYPASHPYWYPDQTLTPGIPVGSVEFAPSAEQAPISNPAAPPYEEAVEELPPPPPPPIP